MSRDSEDLARPGYPLRVEYSEPVEAQIDAAYEWLITLPPGGEVCYPIAERWLTGLQEAVTEEAELQGGPFVLQRSESQDSRPDRARYVLRYRTAGRRSSPWEIVYELRDTDDDKVLDTLRVVAVLHGARER